MKFESSQALANHQVKFCVDGDYGNKEKLEAKLRESASPASEMPGLGGLGGLSGKTGSYGGRIFA